MFKVQRLNLKIWSIGCLGVKSSSKKIKVNAKKIKGNREEVKEFLPEAKKVKGERIED